jgi:hypothetical protein
MDLLSISRCPARAFNRSKYCRKSSKNVWIYMSSTTILNIIKTSPKYIPFFHFICKKKLGSKMDLWSISKCPARAFNRSKYCRKSCKDVWIYMSLTTILNIIKRSPKYIIIFYFIHKKSKVGFKTECVINLWMSSKSLQQIEILQKK